MPLPTPTEDETPTAFIQRCMADQTTRAEYPTRSQRMAVCQQQWTDKDNDGQRRTHSGR